MKTLHESYKYAAKLSQTDKASHYYLDVYQNLFKDIHNPKILEIGIKDGGSLIMWADYFGADSKVVGLDYNKPKDIDKMQDNIDCIICKDAYSNEVVRFLERKYGYFDIIIDDGSKRNDDMRFVVDKYSKLIGKSGFLILEDIVHPLHVLSRISKIGKPCETIRKVLSNVYLDRWPDTYLIDRRYLSDLYDSLLFIFSYPKS